MKIKVKAVKLGYYGVNKRKPSDVFDIEESHFSEKWMKKLVEDKPSEKKSKKEEKKSSSDSEVI